MLKNHFNFYSRNVYNGVYGGHWEKDEGMVEYSIEYENLEGMLHLNASIYTVIPVSTESVPRPQRAAVDVFYKVKKFSLKKSP